MPRANLILMHILIAHLASPPDTWAQDPAQAAMLPIIDMHFHPDPAFDVPVFVKLLEDLGVAKAGNGALEQGPDTDKAALEFAGRNPDRLFAFGFGGIRGVLIEERERAWMLESESVLQALARLDSGLRSGKLKGIGEIHPNNESFQGARYARMRFPADSPLMQRICTLSATHKVPLSVHMDATEPSVGEMERLLQSNRDCTWVWAHAGTFAQPSLLRRLPQAHPNLHLEFSNRVGPTILGERTDTDGVLRPGWKELMEEFQDRIVIGTDRAKPSPNPYSRVIGIWRKVLAQLSPAAVAKIAHGNAERLLRLSPGSPF